MAIDILSAANDGALYCLFMEIGDRIRRERKLAGLTQVQLADRVGVDKSAVAQWESAGSRKGIRTENLQLVADILGIGVERLMGDENNQPERLETRTSAEATLLRLFRRMSPEHQSVQLELFRVFVGLGQPPEAEGHPHEGARVRARRAAKQKT